MGIIISLQDRAKPRRMIVSAASLHLHYYDYFVFVFIYKS